MAQAPAVDGSAVRPTTLLIAAMGGEGGGVLAQWIVAAAEAEGLVVQSTSIPGVAQRTGATTYYIEMMERPEGSRAQPVMSLYPSPGDVDVMVASELIEAGRAMERGFVTPERTLLIASTHRVFAIDERTAMGDGRFDTERVRAAAEALAHRRIMTDFARLAAESGSVINAVLLGAIAGAEVLPVPTSRLRLMVETSGRAVEASLAAFDAGLATARGEQAEAPAPAPRPRSYTHYDVLHHRVRETFPPAARDILDEGVRRLVDWQGEGYAGFYLDRLQAVHRAEQAAGGNGQLVRETGRHLALWMGYEDVLRVAQAKVRLSRFEQVRAEVGAGEDEPVRLVEHLKPGVEEAATLLPHWLGRRLVAWADRRPAHRRPHLALSIPSTAIWGFLLFRLLAALRPLRRFGWRYKAEQERIEAWLTRVIRAAALDPALALEVARLAGLIKGYSDTHRRGATRYDGILATLVDPALAGEMDADVTAAAVAQAREAARADPEGKALASQLAGHAA